MKGKTVVLASILAMTSSFCLADEADHPTFIFRSTNGEQIKDIIPLAAGNRTLFLRLEFCYKNPIVGEYYAPMMPAAQSISGDWITRENISDILTSAENFAKSDNNDVINGSVLAPGSCSGGYADSLRITTFEEADTYYTCHITKESNIGSYKPNGTNIVDIEANDPICHFNP